MSDDKIIVDVRGELCPTPVIETKKAMDASPGQVVETLVDNDVSKENVVKLAGSRHYEAMVTQTGKDYTITMVPVQAGVTGAAGKTAEGAGSAAAAAGTVGAAGIGANPAAQAAGKTLVLTKSYLGEGSEELGEALMKTFLFCLTEADVKPKRIYCINSAVKLTVEGSENLNSLHKLVEAGVEVASCGICLDYYGLKDSLQVGEITNMYAIVAATLEEAAVTF